MSRLALFLAFFMIADVARAEELYRDLTSENVTQRISELTDTSLAVKAAQTLTRIGPRAMPALIETLGDEDRNLREKVAGVLGQMGPAAEAALPTLMALIQQPRKFNYEREELKSYVQAVSKIGRSAVPYLLRALRSDDMGVRLAALQSLAAMSSLPSETTPHLMTALLTKDAVLRETDLNQSIWRHYRLTAAGALGRVGQPAVSALLSVIGNDTSDRSARLWAIYALGEIGPAAQEAVPSLVVFLDKRERDLWQTAVRTLGRIGPAAAGAAPQLGQLMKKKEGMRIIGEALVSIGGAAAASVLAEAMQSSDPLVVSKALLLAEQIGPQMIPYLLQIVTNPATKQRGRAAQLLAHFGTPAVPSLLSLLRQDDLQMQSLAIRVLSDMGPKARLASPLLMQLLSSPDRGIRVASAQALAQIGVSNAASLFVLVNGLEDDDLGIRIAAARTIGGLGSNAAAAAPELIDAMRISQDKADSPGVPDTAWQAYLQAIAGALISIGEPAVPEILEGLLDKDPLVSDWSMLILANLARKNKVAMRYLGETLLSEDKRLRMQAVRTIFRMSPNARVFSQLGEGAVPAMIDTLRGDDVRLRRMASRALTLIGEPAVFPLIDVLEDKDSRMRLMAAYTLGEMGEVAVAVIPEMLELARADDVPDHLQKTYLSRLSLALAGIGEPATEQLVKSLQDKDANVRLTASRALSWIGSDSASAAPGLIAQLKQDDLKARAAAIKALSKIPSAAKQAVPALIESMRIKDELLRAEGVSIELRRTYFRRVAEALIELDEAAVGELLKALGDDDPRVRRYCAWALRRIDPQPGSLVQFGDGAAEFVGKALDDENLDVRIAAVTALKGMGVAAATATPALAVALNDEDAIIRRHAARALNSINPLATTLKKVGDPAIPGLIRVLEENELRISETAVAALAEMGKPAMPQLVEALRHANMNVRAGAAEALGGMGTTATPTLLPIVELLKDPRDHVRKSAAWSLNQIAPGMRPVALIGLPAVPALIEGLKESNKKYRNNAIHALSQIGAPAVPMLVESLNEENDQARLAAAQTIAQIGPAAAPAVPNLIKFFESPKFEIHIAAARALAGMGPLAKDSAAALLKALRIEDSQLKVEGVPIRVWQSYRRVMGESLGEIGPDVIPALLEALQSDNKAYGDWPAIILVKIGDQSKAMVPGLAKAMKHENRRVRTHAGWALRRIDPAEADRVEADPTGN